MEHLTQKQFEDYRQASLPAAELLQVTDHLFGCKSCSSKVAPMVNVDELFLALDSEISSASESEVTTSHLTMIQTADFVDHALAAEEVQIVKDHLAICELCRLSVADLRTFRNNIAPSIEHEYRPLLAPTPETRSWPRIASVFQSLFRTSPVPAFGAALALVALVIAGWMIWRSRMERSPEQQIAQAPTPVPQLPSPAPSQTPVQTAENQVELKDGDRVLVIDRNGSLGGADNLPGSYQGLIRHALTYGTLERSAELTGLNRSGSALMGSDNSGATFSVTEPIGVITFSDKPTFRWTTLNGASGYVVEVYNQKFELVSQSPQLTTRSWQVPAPLRRGETYSWQVKAIKEEEEVISPKPPAAQAKFRILGAAKANDISRARRMYPTSHLTLGLLYADAGLLAESEVELRQVIRQNPDSELAKSLLRQVQTLRRRHHN